MFYCTLTSCRNRSSILKQHQGGRVSAAAVVTVFQLSVVVVVYDCGSNDVHCLFDGRQWVWYGGCIIIMLYRYEKFSGWYCHGGKFWSLTFFSFLYVKKNNLFVYFSLPIYNAITLLLLSLLLLSRVKLRRQARGC